jgi:hypothetical protein
MDFDRRSFFKVCLGTIAAIAVAAIPVFPKNAVAAAVEPRPPENVKFVDNWKCNDYLFRPTIKDYIPGKPLGYYFDQPGQLEAPSCNKCLFEDACTCSEAGFVKGTTAQWK